MEPPSPDPSFAALDRLATGSAPALRTVSLTKNVWERETAYLRRTARSASLAASTQGLEAAVAGAAAGPPGANAPPTPPARPSNRSIFGLPMLSCTAPAYRAWSLCILVLDLTYSAFLLPITIGMQVSDLDWTWACFLDLAAGPFFAAELVLGFHVGFVATSAGKQREITAGRQVAAYYMRRGSFAQDLLSTLIWLVQIILLVLRHSGVHMAEASSAFQVVRIVRMVRFISILRTTSRMTISSGKLSVLPGLRFSPAVTHVINILYAGLVLVNFFGCCWNFIAIKEGFNNTWMNPVGQLVRAYGSEGASILTPEELAAVPGPRRWLTGFYFTLVTIGTLGYGDISPSTAVETAFDCFVIAFGVLMFGIIMGSIAEQISNSSREARQAQAYREKIAAVHAWTRSSLMPKPLKAKIANYYSDVWVKHTTSGDVTAMFFELPHTLRQEIAWTLTREAMAFLPTFAQLDESTRFILSSFMSPLELLPGQELCLRGDLADRFWLLLDGEVEVIDDYSTLRTVQGPAVLGDAALLQHDDRKYCVRPHGYRTATGCSLWEVHLRDIMPFLVAHPEVLDALGLNVRARLSRQSIMSVAALSGEQPSPDAAGGAGAWDKPLALAQSGSLEECCCVGGEDSGGEEMRLEGEVLALPPGSPSPSSNGPLELGADEHTCQEFAADCHAAAEAVRPEAAAAQAAGGWGGRGSPQPSSHSFRGPTVQLSVDARGTPLGSPAPLRSPFEGAEAGEAGSPSQPLGPGMDGPASRGELLQAMEGLRVDLVGRLQDITLDLHRALRRSNTHPIPVWAVASPPPDARPRLGRAPSLRGRTTRQLSPGSSSPSHTGHMQWSLFRQ